MVLVLCVRWAFVWICVFVVVFYETIPSHLYIMGWNPPETNRQNHFAHKRWRVVTRPSTTPINRQAIGTRDHATKFMCEVISSVGFWWRLALSIVLCGEGFVVYRGWYYYVLCVRWAFVWIWTPQYFGELLFLYETIPSVGFWCRLVLSIVVWGRALLYIEDCINIMC